MPQPLINVGPGGPMEAGLASARHRESVEFWHDGESVAFRNLGVEKALGAERFLTTGFKSVRLAQAFVGGARRVYFSDDAFRVWVFTEGDLAPTLISARSQPVELQPFGNWLFFCSGSALFLWRNGGSVSTEGDCPVQARRFAMLKGHLIVVGDDAIAWPDLKSPRIWEPNPKTTARKLQFRDLESPILCVRPIGNGLGVYTRDSLWTVEYKGAGFWFGASNRPLDGIGALGPNSVVAAGFKNYGLNRNGVFVTDGASFQYIDTPPFHGYVQSLIDWTREAEVFSWHNEAFQQVEFYFPALTGEFQAIAYKYTNGGWSKPKLPIFSAMDRNVFDYPVFSLSDGLAYGKGRAATTCFVRTKPLDAGDSLTLKLWEHFRFVGTFSNATVRLGISDQVNTDPTWFYSGPLETAIWYQQEGMFLTIELSAPAEGWFEISQILASGEVGGQGF